MKRILLPLFLIVAAVPFVVGAPALVAATPTLAATAPETSDTLACQPEYKDGHRAAIEFISTHLRYPRSARKRGAEGITVVTFTVTAKGKATDFRVTRSSGHLELDDEALRVCKQLPQRWQPALDKEGKKVDAIFRLPIRFVVQ